jgi:HAD superfamily hydrolase (TIGR01509 family)
MLQALIWDVDGTLAETEELGHRPAFNQAFADEGLAWHWDPALYRELLAITGGKERMLDWWQGFDPAAAATPQAAALIARLHAHKTEHYVERVAQGAVVLRPGVARLLHEARAQGLRLAIATTTSPPNLQALMAATLGPEALGWFEVIGAGDSVPRKKPAPDIYVWVLQQLGLSPREALAIEDSVPGTAAALGAGLPVLVTRSLYSEGDVLPPVLADLSGLGEPGAQAQGLALGQPWQGVVDVVQLRRWLAVDG